MLPRSDWLRTRASTGRRWLVALKIYSSRPPAQAGIDRGQVVTLRSPFVPVHPARLLVTFSSIEDVPVGRC